MGGGALGQQQADPLNLSTPLAAGQAIDALHRQGLRQDGKRIAGVMLENLKAPKKTFSGADQIAVPGKDGQYFRNPNDKNTINADQFMAVNSERKAGHLPVAAGI